MTFDETTGQHFGETMRILHLIKHCQPSNGNVNVAIDLACGQARKGHRVVYASAGGHYDTLLDAHGVRRAEIRQGQFNNPFVLAGNLAALVRLCRSFEPDVIHAHMMSSAVFGYLASKLTGVPLVTTVHNSFDRHAVLMRAGRVVVAVSKAERDFLIGRGSSPARLWLFSMGPMVRLAKVLELRLAWCLPRLRSPPSAVCTRGRACMISSPRFACSCRSFQTGTSQYYWEWSRPGETGGISDRTRNLRIDAFHRIGRSAAAFVAAIADIRLGILRRSLLSRDPGGTRGGLCDYRHGGGRNPGAS